MLDHTDSDSDDDHTGSDSDDDSSEMPDEATGTVICPSKLQLLDTKDVLVKRILRKVHSPNLTWLRWKKCPYSSLPSWISMKILRVLHVQGKKLKTLWKNKSQAPSQLRELRIDAPLKKIPKSIGQLKHLERIEIRHIFPPVRLKKLPDEFCFLQSLKTLVLEECTKMKSLPEWFGNLTNLHHISLQGCSALDRLPISFGRLIELQYLRLWGCTNLTMSSETLGNISSLEYICLSGCRKIEVLPQVVHQRWLEQLYLDNTNLKELPSAFGELSHLEVLTIGGPLLETLPPSLCDLKNLKKLYFYECKELECLPPSLGLLTQLSVLSLYNCPLISELEVRGERETLSDLNPSTHSYILPRLQRLALKITGISNVSFVEGVCSNLRVLEIDRCHNVEEVGTLPNTLASLQIWDCHNLRKLDTISGLAKLGALDIRNCIELEELPGIETLVSLTELRTSGCVKLKSILGLGQLIELQELWVSGCSELIKVEGIQHCMLLVRLDATGCPNLQWSAGVVEQLRQRSGLELTGV